ncbi:MAG: response regulator [Nostoc sp.]
MALRQIKSHCTTILQAEDCLIEIIDSGAAVLAYLETAPNPPDLLILDVMMPKMDGFEVVRHLRESTKFQFIPILLVTSFARANASYLLIKTEEDLKMT